MLFVAVAIFAAPSLADGKPSKFDQDQVLEAVKKGEIRPLAEILAVAERNMPGRVIRIEVDRKRGRVIYELKIIADKGRVREIYIDAGSLEVLKVE